MSWLVLAAMAALQLLAGIVRARSWFHVIRHSWPEASRVRYRDVTTAHLAGVGWNAVLPARAGDAVKIVLVNRRTPERRLSLLASTIVPPALVEAAFTTLLLAGLLATSLVSRSVLAAALPGRGTAIVVAGALSIGLVAVVILRRRLDQLTRNLRSGLAVLGRPRVLATQVVPWLVLGRGLRLLAFALIFPAAGLSVGVGSALALMALQGATPSAGAAATTARIALLAAILSGPGVTDAPAEDIAGALAAAYGVTSAVNLAVSAAVIAWLLRTASPRRIIGYVRSALHRVEPEPADRRQTRATLASNRAREEEPQAARPASDDHPSDDPQGRPGRTAGKPQPYPRSAEPSIAARGPHSSGGSPATSTGGSRPPTSTTTL